MKIFGLDRQLILSRHLPSCAPSQKDILMRPDSALSNSGKELYLFPHLGSLHACPTFVYKVGKVGKFVQKKFCDKYLKTFTMGVFLCSRKGASEAIADGVDPTPYVGFDSSLVADNFVEIDSVKETDRFLFSIPSSSMGLSSIEMELAAPPIEILYEWIEYLSCLYMLKMGDLICYPATDLIMRVERGDEIYVSLDGNELAYVGIR